MLLQTAELLVRAFNASSRVREVRMRGALCLVHVQGPLDVRLRLHAHHLWSVSCSTTFVGRQIAYTGPAKSESIVHSSAL